MKIIIAPDSFKGTMSATKVASIISNEYRNIFPKSEIIELPMADGGEGTTDALISATHGDKVELLVEGPLGEPVTATYGIINNGKTAIMEMASASGIELVKSDKLDPMKASTYGTGEMIKDALLKGVSEIIIGIGGSATVDGGIGMAQALGYKLLDPDGFEIHRGGASLNMIHEIKTDLVLQELYKCQIKVACDVSNPLTGPNGAAAVYGPQKGATKEMVPVLDQGLSNLLNVCKKHNLLDSEIPGDGAAGGLGAGLRAFCSANIESGAELVCKTVDLDNKLKDAAILITGEGKTDSQTLSGKLCAVISHHAKRFNVPVMLISGSLEIREDLFNMFDFVFSTSSGQSTLKELLQDSEKDLRFAATNSAKLLKASI